MSQYNDNQSPTSEIRSILKAKLARHPSDENMVQALEELEALAVREERGEFAEIDAKLEKFRHQVARIRASYFGDYTVSVSSNGAYSIIEKLDPTKKWTFVSLKFTDSSYAHVVGANEVGCFWPTKDLEEVFDLIWVSVKKGVNYADDYVKDIEKEVANLSRGKAIGFLTGRGLLAGEKGLEKDIEEEKRLAATKLRMLAYKATEYANLIDPSHKRSRKEYDDNDE